MARTFVSHGLTTGLHLGPGDSAAVFDAFVTQLTHLLVGTRHLVSKRKSRYAGTRAPWGDTARLRQQGWTRAAHEILSHDGPDGLLETMRRPFAGLTIEDTIVASAVAAYYLEGRPAECVGLIRSIGKRATFEDALATESKLDVGALHSRLVRWLEEHPEAN